MRIKPTAPLWRRFLAALAPLLLLASVSVRAQATAGAATVAAAGPLAKQISGHSAHGSAFDAGPRQKPWKMEGIGHAPFPITTKNPEVQTWFDQGNALLIDKQGRVYWGRFGGDPFTDLAFLEKQLKRMNDPRRATFRLPGGRGEVIPMCFQDEANSSRRSRGGLRLNVALRRSAGMVSNSSRRSCGGLRLNVARRGSAGMVST